MKVRRRLFRQLLAAVATLAMIALAGFGFYRWYLRDRPVRDAAEVESVEIKLYPIEMHGPDTAQQNAEIVSVDLGKIQALLDIFETAQVASEHKCGESGSIIIHTKAGRDQTIGILPGHHAPFYEYRTGGKIYRVDREPFMAAMKALGVTSIALSP
jgi:hypothetical protein